MMSIRKRSLNIIRRIKRIVSFKNFKFKKNAEKIILSIYEAIHIIA